MPNPPAPSGAPVVAAPAGPGLPPSHLLLALAVVAIWGTNFVVIKRGLAEWPPFLFAALRFAVSALPLVLWVKRPRIAWWRIAAFGLFIGAGQFALLFYAMRADISPGLASLVVQTQVFFTIGLAVWWRGERVRVLQLAGLAAAVGGMAVIGAHLDATVTALGVGLVLLAALSWAGGNLVAQSSGRVDPVAFIAWSSLFAVPPLVSLSLFFEGPTLMASALGQASAVAWAVVGWQVIGNSLFGYGAWSWLLARHPAAAVTPMALLVPVFGLGASALVLGEPLQGWKLGAAGLVLGGLALNVLAMRRA
jgi:O-acetylserine/cysteine efflux transporter